MGRRGTTQKRGRKDKKVKSYKMQGNRARGCYLLTMIHLNKLRNHDILRQPDGQIKRRFHGKPTRHCGNLAKPETFNIYLTNCSALLNLHKLKSDTTIAAQHGISQGCLARKKQKEMTIAKQKEGIEMLSKTSRDVFQFA